MNRIKAAYTQEFPTAFGEGQEGMDWAIHESSVSYAATLQFESVSFVCLPDHMEPGYRYPLFVWMNGDSAGPDSLGQVMSAISERNFIGASVRNHTLFPWSDTEWKQTPASIERATESVQLAIREIGERFRIDAKRVFIGGSGSGGTMAFRVAFRIPHLFAGAASLEGEVPRTEQPLGNLTRSRIVPLFWAQLRESRQLPEPVICEQLRLLCVAGFDLTFRQYPAEQPVHDVVFADLNRWMMEQIARQPDSAIVF